MKTLEELQAMKPSTIKSIKRVAKQYGRLVGVTHSFALDVIARQSGYTNYKHALRTLGEDHGGASQAHSGQTA